MYICRHPSVVRHQGGPTGAVIKYVSGGWPLGGSCSKTPTQRIDFNVPAQPNDYKPMSAPVIPARVTEFLAENIDTVPQLEALLLMWQTPGNPWSVDELSVRLYVSKEEAAATIRALQMRGLIVSDDQQNSYRYSADWDASGTLVSEVAQAYRQHLIHVTKFIHSRASSAVRAFARAFDLKKGR